MKFAKISTLVVVACFSAGAAFAQVELLTNAAPQTVFFGDAKSVAAAFHNPGGQQIQVAGQNVTVLSDARGGIILAGDRFVWSSAEPARAANHLKIAARVLAPAAM
jgi:hypothetical protein